MSVLFPEGRQATFEEVWGIRLATRPSKDFLSRCDLLLEALFFDAPEDVETRSEAVPKEMELRVELLYVFQSLSEVVRDWVDDPFVVWRICAHWDHPL